MSDKVYASAKNRDSLKAYGIKMELCINLRLKKQYNQKKSILNECKLMQE